MNKPPIIGETRAARNHVTKVILVLIIVFAVFALVAIAGFMLWLTRAQPLPPPLAEVSKVLPKTNAQLEMPEVPMPNQEEPRPSFTSLDQVSDYYETKGFVTIGRFEKSRWPATIVSEKDGTNEITFVRKRGPRHTYPGYTGYRLKVVSLEDTSGGETMVVLRSKEKIKLD